MEEWKTVKIGELGTVITGKTPKTSIADNYGGVIPFLSPSDNLSGKYVPDTARTLSEKGVAEVKNCLLPAHSICVSCIGSDLGKSVVTSAPVVTNQQFNSIIPNAEYDSDFVYYLMQLVGPILNNLSKTSTAVPIINKSTFSSFEVKVPSYDTQCRISRILSSIDDKIELNNRINHNLEEQAQALYKSWFVDFDPFKVGKFVESELGMIPEGWHIGTVEDLSTRIASGGTPKSMNAEYYSGSINWFSTKELKDCFLFSSEKHITSDAVNNSAAKLFPSGTVLMAIYAAPTVGRLGILNNESTFNQAAVGIIPRIDVGAEFIYLTLLSERDNLNNLASGAAQQNLNVGIVKNYKIVVPPTSVLEAFKEAANPIFQTIKTHSEENTILCSSRDNLLPRLMSGENNLLNSQ